MSGDASEVEEGSDAPPEAAVIRKPFTAADLEALFARLGMPAPL